VRRVRSFRGRHEQKCQREAQLEGPLWGPPFERRAARLVDLKAALLAEARAHGPDGSRMRSPQLARCSRDQLRRRMGQHGAAFGRGRGGGCEKKKTHGSGTQEGCSARSRQGSEARVSKQRAHSVGSAAAAAVTRVLSSTISSTMCAASANEDSRGDDASEVVREVVRMLYVARLHNGTGTSVRAHDPPRADSFSRAAMLPLARIRGSRSICI